MRKAVRAGGVVRWAALGVVGALGSVAMSGGAAQAAGIASARFGGELGHPTTDNPTAIYYNPAGIAFSKGTHIFVDGVLALRSVDYTRPLSAVDSYVDAGQPDGWQPDGSLGANNGTGSAFNAIASPFLGITSDFGTDFLAAGIAFYVPFGGSAVWDKNSAFEGSDAFPGAADGPQRWYTIDGTINSMYLTGAFAYRIEAARLSLGVNVSAIRSVVNTLRARNSSGSDNLVSPATDTSPQRLLEGRSLIDVSGWQVGFGVGAMWEALPDMLWVGASYTSRPNVTGGMTLEGTLANSLGTATPSVTDVELTQDMPDIVRIGFRARPAWDHEIRLFGDWTHWSVVDSQCILDKGVDGGPNCDVVFPDDPIANPSEGGQVRTDAAGNALGRGIVMNLPRFWKDSWGIRTGYSYWFMKEIEGYIGFGYDSNAIPEETIDPALIDMDKFTLSAGGRFQIIENLALQFTYTHVFYMEVDTAGKSVLDDFNSPTRQPSGDGVYTQSIDLLNIAADISF